MDDEPSEVLENQFLDDADETLESELVSVEENIEEAI